MARIGAAIGGMTTTAVTAGMPESAVSAGAGAVETEGMAGVCVGEGEGGRLGWVEGLSGSLGGTKGRLLRSRLDGGCRSRRGGKPRAGRGRARTGGSEVADLRAAKAGGAGRRGSGAAGHGFADQGKAELSHIPVDCPPEGVRMVQGTPPTEHGVVQKDA